MKDLSWLESYSSVNMSIFNTIFWNLLEFAEINYGKLIMNKKRSMLNFKESVAKVKSAPNFGKMAKIGIQTSITKNLIFCFLCFALLESTLGGNSTLGVCGYPLASFLFCL